MQSYICGRSDPGCWPQPAREDSIPASSGRLVLAEIEQDRLDPAVHVALLAQAKFREDRVGVLLDRALGDEQRRGDRRVALALRHFRQDLKFPRSQQSQTLRAILCPGSDKLVN